MAEKKRTKRKRKSENNISSEEGEIKNNISSDEGEIKNNISSDEGEIKNNISSEEEYDLMIPPGTPNLEIILSEVIHKFGVKLISPKSMDEPYYLAVRGNLESIQAAREYFRKRLEETVNELESRYKKSVGF
jgi:hypothetical protein